MAGKNVRVYSTPVCPWCHKVKEFLRRHGVEFEEIDVSVNQEAAQEMVERSGQTGVPVIEVDGEFVVGFDRDRLVKLLDIRD